MGAIPKARHIKVVSALRYAVHNESENGRADLMHAAFQALQHRRTSANLSIMHGGSISRRIKFSSFPVSVSLFLYLSVCLSVSVSLSVSLSLSLYVSLSLSLSHAHTHTHTHSTHTYIHAHSPFPPTPRDRVLWKKLCFSPKSLSLSLSFCPPLSVGNVDLSLPPSLARSFYLSLPLPHPRYLSLCPPPPANTLSLPLLNSCLPLSTQSRQT